MSYVYAVSMFDNHELIGEDLESGRTVQIDKLRIQKKHTIGVFE